MEDRHTIVANFEPTGDAASAADPGVLRSFAGVYDGHNGSQTAEEAAARCSWPSSMSPGSFSPGLRIKLLSDCGSGAEMRHTLQLSLTQAANSQSESIRTSLLSCHTTQEHDSDFRRSTRRLHVILAKERGFASCSGDAAAAEREGEAMREALEHTFIALDDQICTRARAEDARDGSCALVAVRIGVDACNLPSTEGEWRGELMDCGHAWIQKCRGYEAAWD